MKRKVMGVLLAGACIGLTVGGATGCKSRPFWESLELTSILSSPYRVSVAVNGTSSNLSISAIHSKAGTGNLSASGGLKPVTSNLTFKSGDESIATVSSGGQIHGVAVGTVNITVSYTEGNVTRTVDVPVTVTSPPGT